MDNSWFFSFDNQKDCWFEIDSLWLFGFQITVLVGQITILFKHQALDSRTEELQKGAENFASIAEELAKAMEGKKWWQLWYVISIS